MARNIGKIVYDCNKTIHSATKKSSFKLFMRTLGYNTALIEHNEDPDYGNLEDKKYLDRMKRNAPDNIIVADFKHGERVLIKKDFDNNKATKKLKLKSFYETESGIII